MQVKAEARYIRVSPQKARLVVDLIRGQQAGAALTTLRTTNKRIAPTVEKVLRSAIANAQIAEMLWPPTWTARDSGFSLAPPQAGHGTSRM